MVPKTGHFRLPIMALSCLESGYGHREWLRGLGLGQYEAAFRENKIDGEVLPQLTAEDLKDIGVARGIG